MWLKKVTLEFEDGKKTYTAVWKEEKGGPAEVKIDRIRNEEKYNKVRETLRRCLNAIFMFDKCSVCKMNDKEVDVRLETKDSTTYSSMCRKCLADYMSKLNVDKDSYIEITIS